MPQEPRRFVWWSDNESRKNQTVSILAIAETIFAVALYWWIAVKFDTHIHLVTSLFVAPLLLLRSEKSIEKGWSGFSQTILNLEVFIVGQNENRIKQYL
ncbi:MAG: hypothetical protein GKR95_02110 [Gammaproteobacteria bacterium]|nr:hypothetical protein [Gammaproteobacteria bacterium]